MSITKSYNKHTNTYYAYETSYVWDEKLQKKVQKKTCIGKFDQETGEIVPTSRRGRPSGNPDAAGRSGNQTADVPPAADMAMDAIKQEILPAVLQLEQSISDLAKSCEALKRKISMLLKE